MPRRKSNVNQADVQRIIRACQREKVPFRVTLQPNGAAVFEPPMPIQPIEAEPENIAELL
ncbi:MAG: hypothetical protein M9932_02340 [Xanthobacteraceae bacterium]|nr:hypothetical protein [Xanthobacteraceae bacterium]